MINCDGFFSRIYADVNQITLLPDSVYFYHESLEDRSLYVGKLMQMPCPGVTFVDVDYIQVDGKVCPDLITSRVRKGRYHLRSKEELRGLILQPSIKNVYIDVSGLSVRISAPLLKCSLELFKEGGLNVYIVYAEPQRYAVERFSEEGRFHDFAEGIGGIIPIPGFESIGHKKGKQILVALLGFEGGRFAHIIENSPRCKSVPIIGVSGYRPEYPYVSYAGNMRPLKESDSYVDVRYARAGSVVDAFLTLEDLIKTSEDTSFRIAPVGTKPHTIAALLCACCHPKRVEIVYDNPSRKKKRTKGVGNITVTCVSDLVKGRDDA